MPKRKGIRTICQADDCPKIVVSHGYCGTHWSRIKRNGTLEVGILRGPNNTVHERYVQKVGQRGPDECWPWLAALTKSGHAQFWWPLNDGTGRRASLAHRYGWTHLNGPIPDEAVIDHTCHDPRTCVGGVACPHRRCQNPAHWTLVAPTVNTAPDRRRTPADLTHCKHGHEFTPDNTRVRLRDGRERRSCLTCERDRAAAKSTVARSPEGHRLFCKRWHEMTPENTYVRVRDGRTSRSCKACQADRGRAANR